MHNLVKYIYYTLVIISFSLAETYYISPQGSNLNSGSIESPWASLQHAQAQLKAGDTLYIREGIYNEIIKNWIASGTFNNRIIVSGYPEEKAIFDGLNDPHNTPAFLYDFINVSYVTIRNLEIRNYSAQLIYLLDNCNYWIFENLYMHDIGLTDTGWFVSGITIQNSHHTVIKNCIGINIGNHEYQHHWVYFGSNASYNEVYNNYFEKASSAGIHSWHTPVGHNNKIYNNIIKDCYWGYINGNGEENNKIYNNTFYNNVYPLDIRVTKNNLVINNIFFINSMEPRVEVGNTLDFNCWYPDWDDKGLNSISTDSTFATLIPQDINDFMLRNNSPCINRGFYIDSLFFDLGGYKRPSGNYFDIGAFEFQEDNIILSPGNLRIKNK